MPARLAYVTGLIPAHAQPFAQQVRHLIVLPPNEQKVHSPDRVVERRV